MVQVSNDHKDLRHIRRRTPVDTRQWEKLLPQRTKIAYLVLGVFAAKANSKPNGEKTVQAKYTEFHIYLCKYQLILLTFFFF